MHKINYPHNIIDRNIIKDKYYTYLKYYNEAEINKYLVSVILPDNTPLNLKKLVLLEFSEIIDLIPSLLNCSNLSGVISVGKGKKTYKTTRLNELFNYKINQPTIAQFFMECEELNFKTCHYCGIEYINSFLDLDNYKDGVDFLNRANYFDLIKISGIKEKTAHKIISKRKRREFTKISQASYSVDIINQLSSFNFKNGHNHFTLDHVLPQKDYKFLSLCLFNFVPSCYSCNSKFKKAQNFTVNNHIKRISPSSDLFSVHNDFKFKILYNGDFKKITKESDFLLFKKITGNRSQIENYLNIFKINGRYNFHKDKVLHLIKQKVEYPKSRIIELSKLIRLSHTQIKELAFGKEIFVKDSNEPLIKLKKDIAEDLKII